jgi:hypothetical protein
LLQTFIAEPLQQKKITSVIDWTLGSIVFVVGLAVISMDISPTFNSVEFASQHIFFGVFCSLLILMLELSRPKFIENKLWKVLGQLSFCLYLVHPILIYAAIFCHNKMIILSEVFFVSFGMSCDDSDGKIQTQILGEGSCCCATRIDCSGSFSSRFHRSSVHKIGKTNGEVTMN